MNRDIWNLIANSLSKNDIVNLIKTAKYFEFLKDSNKIKYVYHYPRCGKLLTSKNFEININYEDLYKVNLVNCKSLNLEFENDVYEIYDPDGTDLISFNYLNLLNLKELKIRSCYVNISDDGYKNIVKLTNLKKLHIGDGISELGFQYIAKLTNLEDLSIRSTSFKRINFLSNLVNLEYFTLKRLDICTYDSNISKINFIKYFINLKYLNLSYLMINNDDLKNISELTNLEVLYLEGNPAITELKNIERLKKLNRLSLGYTNINKDELKNFDYIKKIYSSEVGHYIPFTPW